MNLDGLSILEVIKIYKVVSAPPKKEVFTPLHRYLSERINTKKVLDDKEIQEIQSLIREIERVFSKQFKQKVVLLRDTTDLIISTKKKEEKDEKMTALELTNIIASFKLFDSGRDKKIFYNIKNYLSSRKYDAMPLSDEEIKNLDVLVLEIEKRFCRDNQITHKIELLNGVRDLIDYSERSRENNLKEENSIAFIRDEMDIKKVVEFCRNYHGINDIDCFNIINVYLNNVINSKINLLLFLENLSDIESLVLEIGTRFSKKKERKRKLLKKITSLLDKMLKEYFKDDSEKSFVEVVRFCKKVSLTEEVSTFKYLNRYLHKRIAAKDILKDNELEFAEMIKNYLEANNSQKKDSDDKKLLYDKVRMLQFLTTVSSPNNTDKLKDVKNVLAKKGRSSELYIAIWDIVNELEKKNIDLQKLVFLLTQLTEKMEKIPKRAENAMLFDNFINYLKEIVNSEKIINRNDEKSLNEIVKTFREEFETHFKSNDKNNKYVYELEIRQGIKDGSIVLNKEFPLPVLASIKLSNEQLEIASKTIFAIDDAKSLDLDGAFSINKDAGCYVFNVYVSDVPSFLKNNKRVCEEAYKRGCSFYIRNSKEEDIMIGMLPEFLSQDYLSLLNNESRDVLDFEFIFNDDGSLISTNVSRKQIRVTYNLTPKTAKKIMFENNDDYNVRKELLLCLELFKKVNAKTDKRYLKSLSLNSISDYIAFPSIFTNYYLADNSQFAIYRDSGKYTRTVEGELYTHSVTPLRKFVSNINLAFFLEQEGIVNFDNKFLNSIEDNIDEIIEHLNQQDRLNEFIDDNSFFAKKYVK